MPPRALAPDDEVSLRAPTTGPLAAARPRPRGSFSSGPGPGSLGSLGKGLGLGLLGCVLTGLLPLPLVPAPRVAEAGKPDQPTVLVLGVQQEGRTLQRARASIVQHLARMGETALGPALGPADLACTASECVKRLARAYKADRVVGAEVIPNDRNYTLQVWLYDARTELPSATEARCVECGPDDLGDMLARTAGHLVEVAPASSPPPPPPRPVPRTDPAGSPPPDGTVPPVETPAIPAPGADPAMQLAPVPLTPRAQPEPVAPPAYQELAAVRPCKRRYATFGRGFAIGFHGALTAAALGTGIGLSAQNGKEYEPGVSTLNYTAHAGVAYGLSGVFALGLGAALMPWERVLPGAAPPGAPECPGDSRKSKWTFGRGLLAGSFSSLLLGGLVSSFALTALDGDEYGEYRGSPATLRYKPHYTASYIASAGMAIGLGLTLFLP